MGRAKRGPKSVEGEPADVTKSFLKSLPGKSPKGAARREEILVGLIEKIAKGDLKNPSLREIGRALDVEPGHILYYFSSREDLLQSVIVRWDDDAKKKSAHRKKASLDTFSDQIARNIDIPGIVHLYLSFATEAVNPDHPAHEFFKMRFENMSATLAQRIRQEQLDGLIPSDVDPAQRARQLIALADGLQLQSLVNPSIDAGEDLRAAIAQLRTSAKPNQAPPAC